MYDSRLFVCTCVGFGKPISKETLIATTTGTIKRMMSDKSFGFIAESDGTESLSRQW